MNRQFDHICSAEPLPFTEHHASTTANSDPSIDSSYAHLGPSKRFSRAAFAPSSTEHSPTDPKSHHTDATIDIDGPPPSEAIYTASCFTVESILQWPVLQEGSPEVAMLAQTSTMELLGQAQLERQPYPKSGGFLEVDRVVLDKLVSDFLEFNFIKNPILDVQVLQREVLDVSENNLQWTGGTCLVLLVCAVGAISRPMTDVAVDGGGPSASDGLAQAEVYFQASQRRMGMLLHENSLLATQCSFLTGVYLMSTMRILAAWKSFAQASTQLQGYLMSTGRIGQHGVSDRPSLPMHWYKSHHASRSDTHPDQSVRAVEESLYWSCLKSELELRVELSLSGSGLNDQHYPNMFPSPPEMLDTLGQSLSLLDQDIMSHSSGNSPGYADRSIIERGWFFYLAEIALRHIVNRAIKANYFLLHGHGNRTSDVPDVAHIDIQELQRSVDGFDQQLHQWLDSLPPDLQFDKSPENPRPTGDILRFILRGHMIDIIEQARYPAMCALLNDDQSRVGSIEAHHDVTRFSLLDSPARDTFLELCGEMLRNCVFRIEANVEGFMHRHQGTWLTIRSCSRSALMLLGGFKWCQKAAQEVRRAAVAAVNTSSEATANDSNPNHDSSYEQHEHRLTLIEGLMPRGWREAVAAVYKFTAAWAEESADIRRLQDVIGALMNQISEEESEREWIQSMGV